MGYQARHDRDRMAETALTELTIKSTMVWKRPCDVSLEYTDEGDWSISIVSAGNTYIVTPEDHTYCSFAVLRTGDEGVEVLQKGVTLEEALEVS